jgi:uncharacterized membrane protein YidH (DUF202 family)
MNKTIKVVLLVVGLALIGYGVFTFIQPEAQVSVGDVDLVTAQDNSNSFIFMGIGAVLVIVSLLGKSK